MGILHQSFFLEYVKHCQGSGTCQVIATKGSTQLTIFRNEIRRYKHATHGETITDALRHAYQVGTDTQPLMGKELTTSTVSTLYLVAYQHRTILLASGLQSLRKLWGSHVHATDTLNTLKDTSADITLSQFFLPCLKVIEGKERDVPIIVDGCDNLGIICHFHCQGSTSVECL